MRERILIACAEQFFKFGVRSITMDDIAAKLGMSKKTIYEYFSTKEQIIVEVSQMYVASEKQAYERIREKATDPIEEMLQFMALTGRTLQGANPSLPLEIRKYFPEAWKILEDYQKTYYMGLVHSNLAQGIAQGYYRSEMDPEVVARFHVDLHPFLFTNDVFPPERFRPSVVHAQYATHFLYGICTPKGNELLQERLKQHLIG